MDDQIKFIIDEYIKKVNEICQTLLEGINEQENLELKTKWDFFEYISKTHRMEFNVNGISYKLHGRGCFAFGSKMFLNWDFGYRSRWCGIDPWILGMTLKKNESHYIEYYDGNLLKEACDQDLNTGEMFVKNGLYHFSIPLKETFSPKFPKDYDTLVIEDSKNKWMLSRNKVIDRFIRKSSLIHNKIYDSDPVYILHFLLNSNEVYSIPYDDICYPENSIKIMTDDIIWNLKKS